MRHKLVITNGATQYPAAENTSSSITPPDPPPYLSRFSQISDSMLKRGSAKSTDRKVRDPTISRVTGPSSIASSLEDSRVIKSPSVSKTRLLEKVGSVKVPVTLAKPNELQVKTANATQISMGNESKNSSRIQPVPQLGIAHTHVENKINPTTHASSHSPRAKTPPSTFSASRDASLSENISLKPNIGRVSHMQTHAKVSLPGDSSELEARTVAKSVMSMTASTWSPEWEAPAMPNTVQIPTLGGGFPLSTRIRNFMEPRFQQDLGHVRIHTGEQADRICSDLRARAFTVGSHIFFGKDQFQPNSKDGLELIAHELTHTFQQGTTIRRSEEDGVSTTQEEDEGGIFSKALNFIAEHVNDIPGFRMFTIILGVNPINMSRVDSSPANIMRALIEFIPGGALVTEALDNHGIFDKVANWAEDQIKTLGLVASSIKQAIITFAKSVKLSDLLHLENKWEEAKRIFTEPIERIKNFAKGLITDIIKFIKDAILMPLAALASQTPFWDLLVGVLGKNPITDEEVPRSAEKLIGGFMKLIGQEEVWENMQKAKAVDRVWAWFQNALSTVIGFVSQIPTLAKNTFEALKLEDIVQVATAFEKVAGVFGNFVSDFTNWALDAVWNLLEIIFEVVKPGALEYVKRTGAALKSILQNPIPFVGNLVKAAKLGFENFALNFGVHLKKGLIDWLTGSLPGVYIPQAFSLGEIAKFVFSVLGISWQIVRQKLVKVVGEQAVKAMETGFDIVVTLVTQGPAAAWDKIKEHLSNLKDMVIGGITDLVVDAVVKKAIPKLIAMFVPGAGFLSAIMSIYDTVMVFVNKLSQIGQVVIGFINSIMAIASGDIGGAASRVENILAGIISLAINFLAGFVGLGKIADKITGVIEKIRVHIDKGLDALVAWIVKMAKKVLDKILPKKEKQEQPSTQKSSEPTNNLQRPTITVAFMLGGESHELILDPKGGDIAQVEMASANRLPFDRKYRDAYNGIEYFKQYMTSITDAQVRREFETRFRPLIDKFQSPSIEAWKKIYDEHFPKEGRGPPITAEEARGRADAVHREAEALLESLRNWGATSGIRDLSKDAVVDAWMDKGKEIWEEAWNKRKQQVDTTLGSISYKGRPLEYRGSLALGYRGHISKNYVAFNPDDFDVDLYVVHEADYVAAAARGARTIGGQIRPNDVFAPAELKETSTKAQAALVGIFPDIAQMKETYIALRGAKP